jgi:hypothetical protein
MPTFQDLVQAVTNLLSIPAAPTILQLNSATRERAFEAYIFSLVQQAVKQTLTISRSNRIRSQFTNHLLNRQEI